MHDRAAEYSAVRRSYRSFTRSAGLLGEEYPARRFRTVEVGMCLKVRGSILFLQEQIKDIIIIWCS
jgi:hypothetical protein